GPQRTVRSRPRVAVRFDERRRGLRLGERGGSAARRSPPGERVSGFAHRTAATLGRARLLQRLYVYRSGRRTFVPVADGQVAHPGRPETTEELSGGDCGWLTRRTIPRAICSTWHPSSHWMPSRPTNVE